MENNNVNILIELFKNNTKPNISQYTLEELTYIYNHFIYNKTKYLEKIKNTFLYSDDITNIIENIFNETCVNIQKNNIIEIHKEEEIRKKILNNWFEELWKKIPLFNNNNEIIDCVICLNYITKNDYIIFQCEHITHSTCFFNYLFSNLKNNSNNIFDDDYNKNNLIKLFRCPNCRNFLTDLVKKSFESNYVNNNIENNIVENNIVENNIENNIENEYGDEFNNLILQEYNLVANSLDNQLLNNIFRMTNNVGFRMDVSFGIGNINNNFGSNIVIDSENDSDSISKSDTSISSDLSISSD
jgi:hypothetical protein